MNMLKRTLLVFLTAVAGIIGTPMQATADTDPYVGETMLFGGTFCPRGWAEAAGQLLAIQSNQTLFSVYGTLYGGDGRTTFGLPDLRGRTPIGTGSGPGLKPVRQGQKVGRDNNVTITVQNMPAHNHLFRGYNQPADKAGPGNKYLATPVQSPEGAGPANIYTTNTPNRLMAKQTLTMTGDNRPFSVLRPVTALRWCVALQGVYPPRS